MSSWDPSYGDNNNNNNNDQPKNTPEMAAARAKIGSFLKASRKLKPLRRAIFRREIPIATRKAANFERGLAARKAAVVANLTQKAAELYNIGTAFDPPPPLNEALIQQKFERGEDAEASRLIQEHEDLVKALKLAAIEQFQKAMLESYRLNTNATAANLIKQIPSFPKHSRSGFHIFYQLDDLFGKLTHNLSIASTKEERERIAAKKYNVEKLREKIRKVVHYDQIPPGLMREIEAALAGEDVAGLLAPTLPVANRMAPAFANYNARKNARYQTLKNMMNKMNTTDTSLRENIALLAALEEILEINMAQPTEKKEQRETLQKEIDRISALKAVVEKAIEEKSYVDGAERFQIFKAIKEYLGMKSNENSIYKRLNANRKGFNIRNAQKAKEEQERLERMPVGFRSQGYSLKNSPSSESVAAAEAVAQQTAAQKAAELEEKRRRQREAAMKRFQNPPQKPTEGGRKTRRNRKN